MFDPDHRMTARQIVEAIASMKPYSIDSSDDALDDAVATLNRLIGEAKTTTRYEAWRRAVASNKTTLGWKLWEYSKHR